MHSARRDPDTEVRFGIIADDLTGAMDTGLQFYKVGLTTLVHLTPASVDDLEVSVVDTQSRDDSPDVAREKVKDAARRLEGRVIYKKIDSTLRGNIGYELDAVMDELHLRKALVAPAFPANGRTALHGRLLVNGHPLRETDFSGDPICPPTDLIPVLLAGQSERSVGHIPLDIVDRGPEALREEVETRGEQLLVVDASSDAHLLCIARAASHLGAACLTCGSAGLARVLPIGFGFQSQERPSPKWHPTAAPVLVVAGSRHPVTVGQIERAVIHLGAALIELDARCSEVATGQVRAEANRCLSHGKDVIITAAYDPYLPERSQAVAMLLGNLAADIAREQALSGLVLTGGSIAFSTCCALGVATIEIQDEVAPGIPAGAVLKGEQEGTRLVTKAGGFGKEDALLRAIEYLRGGDA